MIIKFNITYSKDSQLSLDLEKVTKNDQIWSKNESTLQRDSLESLEKLGFNKE